MYNICLSVETKKSQYFVLQEFYKIFFFNSRYRPYLADVAEMHIFKKFVPEEFNVNYRSLIM